ncbi:MAG: signal peptidase I [Chloroflexi bacterium]|nr:signal peptidase I [Chloroflexota bacterium]
MTPRVVLAKPIPALRRGLDLAFLALALVVVAALVLSRRVPLTGRITYVVGGPSMEPSIHQGSAIVVEPVDPSALGVGDLVSMRVGPEQAVFTHRIVRIVDRSDGLWLETKGDANATPDPVLVPASAVIGRVVVAISGIGYVIAALSTSSGLLLAGGMAGVLLALVLLLEGAESGASRRRAAGAASLTGRA